MDDQPRNDISGSASGSIPGDTAQLTSKDSSEIWHRLKLPPHQFKHAAPKNANEIHKDAISPLDKLALVITERVGSMGFFLIIFGWTIIWCGYNILASEVGALHWKSFDPFPAFVAYLLISNVIQILLMPLIMVGQNLQSKHSEIRAELDFETNKIAEQEIAVVLRHLEHNTDLLIQLMRHLECRISDDEIRMITAEHQIADHLAGREPKATV